MCGHNPLRDAVIQRDQRQNQEAPVSGPAVAPPRVASRPCSQCGASVQEDFVFCPRCGAELLTACPECHRAVETSWTHCAYCGADLVAA